MSPTWIGPAIAALGVACLVVAGTVGSPRARAAERTLPGAYEVIWLRAGKDYRADRPSLGWAAGPYASRAECEIEIVRVKAPVSGARLMCAPVEGRVR